MLLIAVTIMACLTQPLQAAGVQQKSPTGNDTFLNDLDQEQPVIEHTAGSQGLAGDAQTFNARVTDNRSVAEVVLFFRASAELSYQATRMSATQGSNDYRATVLTTLDQSRVEYYFSAVDVAGQKTLSGFPYSPYIRTLLIEDSGNTLQAQTELKSPNATQATSGARKWLYIALGVLAVGAIAAASGGDSGASTGGTGPDTTGPGNTNPSVPVTISLPLPQ